MTRVNEILDKVGKGAYQDPHLGKLLLDEPTTMGVTQLEVESLTVQMVARTLPGKQFEVSGHPRLLIAREFVRAGIPLAPDSLAADAVPAQPGPSL